MRLRLIQAPVKRTEQTKDLTGARLLIVLVSTLVHGVSDDSVRLKVRGKVG